MSRSGQGQDGGAGAGTRWVALGGGTGLVANFHIVVAEPEATDPAPANPAKPKRGRSREAAE